jgi:hypothetical protein
MDFGGSGLTTQLTAIGTYTKGSHPATTKDITDSVTWTSSTPECVTVNSTGLITSGSNTCSNILVTATAHGFTGTITGSMTVNVTQTTTSSSEPVVSLSISPATYSETVGQTAFFKAFGTNGAGNQTDLTTLVAWSVTNPQVATIGGASGAATAVGSGSTQINAVYTNPDKTVVPAAATLTVTGTSTTSSGITALSIIPGSQTIALPEVGQPNPTVSLVVLGTNAAGLQTNQSGAVTWVSSNPAVLPTTNIVDGTNAATATVVGAGTTTLTATFTNVSTQANPVASVASSTATLTATEPTAESLLSLAITPSTPTAQFPTQTTQLTAVGTFSQAPVTQNLTKTATWSSSNPLIATVCNATATGTVPASCATTPGLVTAVGQGTGTITATATSATDGSFVYATVPYTVQAGSAQQMSALTIVPSSLTLSATGQPGSLIALGTSTNTGLQVDVTNSPQMEWSSSNPTIATVCTTLPAASSAPCTSTTNGQVTGVSAGSTTITAEYINQAATGSTSAVVQSATASITVTATPAAEPLLSITILPTTISTGNLLGTGQYMAFGAFSTAPTELDITNGFYHSGFPNASCTEAYATADEAALANGTAIPSNSPCTFVPVTWVSDAPFIFPIDSAGSAGATGGLVTADGTGTDDIYAEATNPDGTLVYSTTPATFNCPYVAPTYATYSYACTINGVATNCTGTDYSEVISIGSCNELTIAPELVSTLTVYGVGLNMGNLPSNWLITAPSATGTPDVIHCGGSTEQAAPGGSVCTATYPNTTNGAATTVTLTAPTEPGVNFGGWSDNCTSISPNPSTATGPNTCTVTLGSSTSSNVSVVGIFN